MKNDGMAAKKLVDMTKGTIPFDLAVVQASLKTFARRREGRQRCFRTTARPAASTAALPSIWQNKADFNARFVKFGKDVANARGRRRRRGELQEGRSLGVPELRRLSRTLQGQERLTRAGVRMKRAAFIVAAIVVAGAGALAWGLAAPKPRYSPGEWDVVPPGDAAAGRIVFFAGGCDSCHKTPDQPDPLRLGGGLELKTPFGSFYPPNISSDPADGIGGWRSVDIANALLSGVSRDGRHLYPAFPYTSYQRMTPKDVADLIAFLRVAPAVQGKAPANVLPFPFSIRRAVGLWKLLFFDDAGLRPDPGQSETWNRGRYLVEGPGHCGECHTPRGLLGEMDESRRLAGAPSPDGRGKAPNLRGGEFADWSTADVVEALTSGFTPSGDVLGAGMTSVVRNLAELPAADREAIAIYLKSLPPYGAPVPAKPTFRASGLTDIKASSLRNLVINDQRSTP